MTEHRPLLHFSPRSGWINDPNGLIRIDGVHHLFYQHNPDALIHGPMHWGHATSRDLAVWQEQLIALFPDAAGQCFSGSAVAAGESRVAQEFAAGDGVLLFYTTHRADTGGSWTQEQSIAVADRGLGTFRKFAGNPVVASPGAGRDFRDPRVSWHAPTRRWVMVVTLGQSVGIYTAPDALDWRFESAFGVGEGHHHDGPWECPDLLPIAMPGSNEPAWLLIVGVFSGHPAGGSGTQYFIGDFDGRTFVNRHPPDTVLWLDHGRDYYAAQTFSGTGSEPPLAIAWMSNWAYANHTPAVSFRGSMTLPRRLHLVPAAGGFRVAQSVEPSVASRFTQHAISQTATLDPGSGTFRLTLTPGAWRRLDLRLFGETDPVVSIERHPGILRITTHRLDHRAVGHTFGFTHSLDLPDDGPHEFDVFADAGLVEISCLGGRYSFTTLFAPEDPAGQVSVDIA